MSTSTESYIARKNTIHQSKLFLLPLILVGRNNHSIKFIFLFPQLSIGGIVDIRHTTFYMVLGCCCCCFVWFFFYQKKKKKKLQGVNHSLFPLWKNKTFNQRNGCANFQHMAGTCCKNHPAEKLSHGITKISQKHHQLKNRTLKI